MRKIIFILLTIISAQSYATHNRAGEITYKHISGLLYEITVITYTKESSPADRPRLEVNWGDITGLDSISRTNRIILGNDIVKNVYVGQHVYPGPSPVPYVIRVQDPNRNADVVNIPNSVNVIFYIETLLYINPFIGLNNSPDLLNPPIDNACVGIPYVHNPGAFDVDGDSLYYSLQESRREGGLPIFNYQFPPASISLTINSQTGELIWDSPTLIGEYNVAILIEEFRGGEKIGSILRDMQITVSACLHTPPVITTIFDTCIIAGDTLSFPVKAVDSDFPPQLVTLTATGGPLNLAVSPAIFIPPAFPASSVTGNFYWETSCANVRQGSYLMSFKAVDNGVPNLTDFHSTTIRVIGPKPKNLTAVALGNTINLTWSKTECSQVVRYKIYRRSGASGWSPDYCETGVPGYTGFQLIAQTTTNNDITFSDDNNGLGLVSGQDYCYRIVADYPDGAESKASDEVCVQLKKDVPIITNVSVDSTSTTTGTMDVVWTKPTEHDTIQYPGPYRYLIYRGLLASSLTLIDSTASINDTIYKDTLINTQDNQYYYRIDVYNLTAGTRDLLGKSSVASSVYLNVTPSDNQLTLSWTEFVPWTNTQYVIYRQNPITLVFDSLDITSNTTYIDMGLANLTTYCYKIKSIGIYTDTTIVSPLINYSEIKCEQPIDNVIPCAPASISIEASCDLQENKLQWTNQSGGCSDDVLQYNIYKKDSLTGDYNLVTTITSAAQTNYLHDQLFSIAGCYAVAGLDSVGNESLFSDSICVDNCPTYRLPNIFTPGGDGMNDIFGPFPYKFVHSISIQIFNRWGNLVFETTDADIMWDGVNIKTKKQCSDGVYYYVCIVNEIKLEGIRPRILKGFVHLMSGKNGSANF